MRISVDIQSAITQTAGVGRYTRSLVRHLGESAAPGDTLVLTYFDFRRRGIPFDAPNAVLNPVRCCPGRWVQFAWKTIGWPPFDGFAGPADLYHFPNFIRPPLRHGKSVVCIHDMSFMRFPHFTEEGNLRYLSTSLGNTVKNTDAIITISRFSAGEIAELLRVEPARVFVTYPGIAETFKAPPPENILSKLQALGIRRPYLLAVGTLEPRKNYSFLLDVFEKLDSFDGDLVIAGMRGWKCDPILERLRTSPKALRIRWLNHVDDSNLPALYAGAECFLFPSLYEGFGFPPLEAMACGTPVVSSAGGSLAEVLGDGAVVLDSFDIDRWTAAIERLRSDVETRKRQVAAGLRQSARYPWSETARQTWQVYRKVAG